MIKRLLQVGDLTVPEQRVVIFLLCALIAVAAVRYYRVTAGGDPSKVTSTAVDQPSPSPGIRP